MMVVVKATPYCANWTRSGGGLVTGAGGTEDALVETLVAGCAPA
jgi:hypothetical protein